MILNTENALRKVDRGPAPSPDMIGSNVVTDFKKFWGEKCELRRFKDRAIVEAVVWQPSRSNNIIPAGESICEEILRYLLGRYFPTYCGKDGQKLTSGSCRLEQSLPCSKPITISEDIDARLKDIDYLGLCQKAVVAIDSLRGLLTSKIQGLPLIIDSLVCMQPCARYTALYPPLCHPVVQSFSGDSSLRKLLSGRHISRIVEPIHLHGLFGHSGKWPDDLSAQSYTITAFIVLISELLLKQFKVYVDIILLLLLSY
jgi:U3 small nucleolar RNA-associated protein 22